LFTIETINWKDLLARSTFNPSPHPGAQMESRMNETERELLAALQALVAQVERGDFDHIGADHPDSAVGAARAAIEKAEGCS
jgi:hypothetical protein